MTWANIVVGGVALAGSLSESEAQKQALESQAAGVQGATTTQQQAQRGFERRTQPFADVGLAAAPALAQLLGLNIPDPQISRLTSDLASIDERIAAGPPPEPERRRKRGGKFGSLLGGFIGDELSAGSLAANIGEQIDKGFDPNIPSTFNLEELTAQRADIASQLEAAQAAQPTGPLQTLGAQTQIEEINPILSFLRDEGFEDIQESAAARGRLGAGGTLKDLTRFNTQLASTVVPQLQQQRFSQLFNLLGLGGNVATGQGTAALQTAGNVSNLQLGLGQAQAGTALAQGQNQRELLTNLSGTFGNFLENRTPPPPVIPQQVGGTQNPNQFAGNV